MTETNIYKKSKSGQSLIEVILVVAMTSVVLLALVALGNIAIRNTKLTLQRSEAVKLATSAMEAVRYVRDTPEVGCGFDSIYPAGTTSTCLNLDQAACGSTNPPSTCICNTLNRLQNDCAVVNTTSWVNLPIIENTSFQRLIKISPNTSAASSTDTAKVDITIRWPVGNGMQEYTLTTVLSKN